MDEKTDEENETRLEIDILIGTLCKVHKNKKFEVGLLITPTEGEYETEVIFSSQHVENAK